MLVPLVYVTAFLGQAFDMKNMESTDKYIFDDNDVAAHLMTIEKPSTRSEYKLVESSSDANNFLDINGELALKIKDGKFQIKGSGEYLKENIDRDNTVELLLTVYHETVAETFPSYLTVKEDWKKLQPTDVGTHYIRSIVYGGQLVVSYQLTANNSNDLQKIKASVNANLETKGSFSGDVNGKFKKLDKEVRETANVHVKVYEVAAEISNITEIITLDDALQLIDNYPNLVKSYKNGKGVPLKVEVVPLGTLNSNFSGSIKNDAANAVLQDAIDKFDDIRSAYKLYNEWSNNNEPPEDLEDEFDKYDRQLQMARTAMRKAINRLDLSKTTDIHHFDEAFEKYGDGGFNIPLRYTRTFKRLMNLLNKVTPHLYPYTRAETHYTHWGSVNCTYPSPRPLMIGLAAASPYGYGSGANLQCLGLQSTLEVINVKTEKAALNGLTFITPDGTNGTLLCARCHLENASSVITIPAKKECPSDMKLEYKGFIATGFHAVTEPICVDLHPDGFIEDVYPEEDSKANSIRPMRMECRNCENTNDVYIPCVVCSR